jgi:hypothetical protein
MTESLEKELFDLYCEISGSALNTNNAKVPGFIPTLLAELVVLRAGFGASDSERCSSPPDGTSQRTD